MQVDWADLIRSVFSQETAFTVSVGILIIGVGIAYFTWRWTHEFLGRVGVTEAAEGTSFERTAQSLGTSTAGIVAQLAAIFVYVGTVIVALEVGLLRNVDVLGRQVAGYMPSLFIAAIAIIGGLIGGEKARLVVSERLRSIKLPEADIIPELVKYSIFYIAGLLALAQIGVATSALLVLLASYAFGIVLLSGLAFRDLLAAGAAGVFLLLSQPYSIGDEVAIGDHRGIVQEIDMFVTHIENDDEEYIVPNSRVFERGVVRIRE